MTERYEMWCILYGIVLIAVSAWAASWAAFWVGVLAFQFGGWLAYTEARREVEPIREAINLVHSNSAVWLHLTQITKANGRAEYVVTLADDILELEVQRSGRFADEAFRAALEAFRKAEGIY